MTEMESSESSTLARVEDKVDRLSRFVEALAQALEDSRMIDSADFRLRLKAGGEASRSISR